MAWNHGTVEPHKRHSHIHKIKILEEIKMETKLTENQLELRKFMGQQKQLEKKAQQAIIDYTHKSIVNTMMEQQKNNTHKILYGM